MLCVVSLKLFFTDGRAYATTGGFGRQMEALATHFDAVLLCVPVARGMPAGAYGIDAPNVSVCPLPPYRTQPQFLLAAPRIAVRVLRAVLRADIVCARMPDLTGWLGFVAARLARKPVFINLVGDWGEVILVRDETGARGPARQALRLYVRAYEALERYAARRALTFTTGQALYNKYMGIARRLRLAVSTTVREQDIAPFRDTCLSDKVRLLFVGRLTRAKGLPYLVEAVAALRASGFAVTLDLVGDGETRHAIESDVGTHGLADSVSLHGMVPQGDALRTFYRAADVFVLPSVSEGTPKVLLEAMANAVPVVATDAGGVSTVVENGVNGLLVPPKSPSDLASAIRRVVEDGDLRRRIIQGGLRTARLHTLEGETARMIEAVRAEFGELWGRSEP